MEKSPHNSHSRVAQIKKETEFNRDRHDYKTDHTKHWLKNTRLPPNSFNNHTSNSGPQNKYHLLKSHTPPFKPISTRPNQQSFQQPPSHSNHLTNRQSRLSFRNSSPIIPNHPTSPGFQEAWEPTSLSLPSTNFPDHCNPPTIASTSTTDPESSTDSLYMVYNNPRESQIRNKSRPSNEVPEPVSQNPTTNQQKSP